MRKHATFHLVLERLQWPALDRIHAHSAREESSINRVIVSSKLPAAAVIAPSAVVPGFISLDCKHS